MDIDEFVSVCSRIADYKMPLTICPSRKYTHHDYLFCLTEFVETRVSWNKYAGPPEHPIKGKYLH